MIFTWAKFVSHGLVTFTGHTQIVTRLTLCVKITGKPSFSISGLISVHFRFTTDSLPVRYKSTRLWTPCFKPFKYDKKFYHQTPQYCNLVWNFELVYDFNRWTNLKFRVSNLMCTGHGYWRVSTGLRNWWLMRNYITLDYLNTVTVYCVLL